MSTRFCMCPPRVESLFPPVPVEVLQVNPTGHQSASLGIPSPFSGSPSQKLEGAHNLYNSGRTTLVFVLSLWIPHLESMRLDFIVTVPLLPSYRGFSFVFGHGYPFLVGSSIFLLMVVQQLVAIPVISQEEIKSTSFYSAILNQSEVSFL